MSFDFLIVGAGFYGATFARLATDAGYSCLVIDRRNHVAGNAYTELDRNTNIIVHKYGPHIFHTNDEVIWNFVNKFAKFNNYIHTVKAYNHGSLYSLPFNMNTFYELYKTLTPEEALDAVADDIEPCDNIETLEQYALATVGRTVYETLIKGYTQKQWNKFCSELPASIIKRLPIRWEYNNNYFNDRYQGIPEQGYTTLIENMLNGIEVRLNTDMEEIKTGTAKIIVYSGAIDEYFDYCYGHLEYRSLRFDEHKTPTGQGIAVINYTCDRIPYTRSIDHRYFNPGRSTEGNIRTYEYPVNWQPGAERYYPVNTAENQVI